jgi:hypothetical protein
VRRLLAAAHPTARQERRPTSRGASTAQRPGFLAVGSASDGCPAISPEQNASMAETLSHFLSLSPLSVAHVGDGGWRSLSRRRSARRRPWPTRPTARQPSSSLPFPVHHAHHDAHHAHHGEAPRAPRRAPLEARRGLARWRPSASFPWSAPADDGDAHHRGQETGGWVACPLPPKGSLPFGGGEGVSPHRPCSSSRCLGLPMRIEIERNWRGSAAALLCRRPRGQTGECLSPFLSVIFFWGSGSVGGIVFLDLFSTKTI